MSGILVNEAQLLGAVARWAIQQSPYHRPDNLEVVLDKLHASVKDFFKVQQLGFAEFSDNKQDLRSFIHEHLSVIPEYLLWNDRKNGNDAPMQFTSRYDTGDDPDNDFIDLDAMEMNVVRQLEQDSREAQS